VPVSLGLCLGCGSWTPCHFLSPPRECGLSPRAIRILLVVVWGSACPLRGRESLVRALCCRNFGTVSGSEHASVLGRFWYFSISPCRVVWGVSRCVWPTGGRALPLLLVSCLCPCRAIRGLGLFSAPFCGGCLATSTIVLWRFPRPLSRLLLLAPTYVHVVSRASGGCRVVVFSIALCPSQSLSSRPASLSARQLCAR